MLNMLNDEQLLRYSRQLLLNDFDLAGQEKLRQSHVAVIGCGGLGMAALPMLVGSGIGRLTIADFDNIDLSNLHRQTFYQTDDVGQSKVRTARKHLNALNPEVDIRIVEKKITDGDLEVICQEVDTILDCTDNFSIRKSINHATFVHKKPLISGSAVRYEGQLAVYDFRDPQSPCYACLFEGEDSEVDEPCALFGVFPPVVHIIGATQAQEALKLLLGIGTLTTHQLKIYHALESRWESFSYRKNPACLVCA